MLEKWLRRATHVGAGLALVLAATATTARAETVIDLTTAGSSGSGVTQTGDVFLVQQIDPQSTGTGVIDPFLRIQGNESEAGYNTEVNNPPLETKAGIWTHDITLGEIPVVTINGVQYLQFLLDINQNTGGASNELLSLNQVQILLADSGAPGNCTVTNASTNPPPDGTYAEITAGCGTEVFQMSTTGGVGYEIKMNYDLNPGSGAGDAFFYVAVSSIEGYATSLSKNLVLFSQFGTPNGAYTSNDGFEEWAVLEGTTSTPVPEPASLLLLGTGLGLVGRRVRRMRATV